MSSYLVSTLLSEYPIPPVAFHSGTDFLTFDLGILPTDVLPGGELVDGLYVTTLDIVSGSEAGFTITLTGNLIPPNLTTAHLLFASGGKWIIGDDKLGTSGDDLNNTLTGSAQADALAGMGGNDVMKGGGGDDFFYLGANGPAGHDTVQGSTGIDTVDCYDAHTAIVVNLGTGTLSGGMVLADSAALSSIENFVGGAHADSITGSNVANQLTGNGGNDTISGGGGDDLISGGAGDDSLNGGTGWDTLQGGKGNDVYIVNTQETFADLVTELPGEGKDTVKTSLGDYELNANVEDLVLTRSTGATGTGNGLNNRITGTAGMDHLRGFDGNDTLLGAGGNDLLLGGAGGDVINGGTGNDTLYGDSGDLTPIGDAGGDVLTGGTGNDTFEFKYTKNETITDFQSGIDLLSFDRYRSDYPGGALGPLSPDLFASGPGVTTSATAAFIYDTNTGDLYYNALTPFLVAHLVGAPELAASDIYFYTSFVKTGPV